MSHDHSAREVIEARWPYDGPHTDDDLDQAADALYELVRRLNNYTSKRGISAPAAYDVLASVSSAVAALDQLLRQTHAAIAAPVDDPRVYDDSGRDPATTLTLATTALTAARLTARDLRESLQEATTRLACIGRHD